MAATDDAGIQNSVLVVNAKEMEARAFNEPSLPAFSKTSSRDLSCPVGEDESLKNQRRLYGAVTPVGTIAVEGYFDDEHVAAPRLAHEFPVDEDAAQLHRRNLTPDAAVEDEDEHERASDRFRHGRRVSPSFAHASALAPIQENMASISGEAGPRLDRALAASDPGSSHSLERAYDQERSTSDPSGSTEPVVPAFVDTILHGDVDEEVRLEHAPLFAYECMGAADVELALQAPESPFSAVDAVDGVDAFFEDRHVVDLDDPLLEWFPSDGPHIFEFIRSVESRLGEDLISEGGSKSSSPQCMPGTPVDAGLSKAPSPTNEYSQRLHKIPEQFLSELDLDVHSPTLFAFNVHRSDGVLLDQDGLFDFPRRLDACRHADDGARLAATASAMTLMPTPRIVTEDLADSVDARGQAKDGRRPRQLAQDAEACAGRSPWIAGSNQNGAVDRPITMPKAVERGSRRAPARSPVLTLCLRRPIDL